MNSRERCLGMVRGEPVDRVPVFPLLMHLSADRLGISYRRYATDGAGDAAASLISPHLYREFAVP